MFSLNVIYAVFRDFNRMGIKYLLNFGLMAILLKRSPFFIA